jgi:hypothetical protein
MNFTGEESTDASAARSAPRTEKTATFSKVSGGRAACLTAIGEKTYWSPAPLEENGREAYFLNAPSRAVVRRFPTVTRPDRLEESLYWLFSAATLGYLLVVIIGM